MAYALPTQPFTPDNIPVTRICLGCMGLSGTWNPADFGPENVKRAVRAFEASLEYGINFFDHADFYGSFTCETVFKDCLAAVPGIREKIFIATKAGIRPGFYDHSPEHIRASIRGSLDRMGLDYVDLYQLHRPDPLSDPEQTAQVLQELLDEGLIRYVGVSNYYPRQTAALQKYLKVPIVSNQISLSLTRLDPIYEGAAGQLGIPATDRRFGDGGDGVLDQCLELKITPLAYSPLGGGWLSGRREIPADHGDRARLERIFAKMDEIAPAYGSPTRGQLALAWLLRHPAKIVPIVGSTNPDHIKEAVESTGIALTREDWYRLWVAARGENVP